MRAQLRSRGAHRWRRAATLALSALALGCVFVPERTQTRSWGAVRDGVLPAHVTVLSWNIHKATRSIDRELERFSAGCDLVLLQEAVPAAADHTRTWTMVEAFLRRRDDRPAGVATGARISAREVKALRSDGHEPFAGTPKSALVSTYRLRDGRILLVVNLHGINFRPARELEEQLVELEPLVAAHDGPAVVAGDFNTWSRRRRAVMRGFAQRLGLQRVGFGPREPPLDHVLYRGLTVERADVLRSRRSDHDALRVEFR